MDRSPGFGYYFFNDAVLNTRFRYAFTLCSSYAEKIKSLAHYAKGTPMITKYYYVSIECILILDFKICFTPIDGFFSPFPYGTCSLSVLESVKALKVVLHIQLSSTLFDYMFNQRLNM